MTKYYVKYRIDNGVWNNFGPVMADSKLGAIAKAAQIMADYGDPGSNFEFKVEL